MAARLGDGDEPDDATCWVALAAAQHETGHLRPQVRDRALALIDGEAGLETWDEAGLGARRRAVLNRLADRLRGPQPAPKRLRGPRPLDPGVRVGDVVRVRRSSLLVAVIAMEEKVKGRPSPLLLGLYEPADAGAPTAEQLARMPYLSAPGGEALAHPYLHWLAVRRGERLEDLGELIARDVRRPDGDPGPQQCTSATTWEDLGEQAADGRLEACRRVTRRRLARFGDAPDAWRTERAERFAALGLPDPGDDPRDFWRAHAGELARITPAEAEADPERVGELALDQLRRLGIDVSGF
jgi:hypothetical protein